MANSNDHSHGAAKRRDRIRRFWKHNPKTFVKALLEYVQAPQRDLIKLRRARSAEKFCEARKHKAPAGSDRREWWAARKRAWTERADRLEKKVAAQAAKDRSVIPRSAWGAPACEPGWMTSENNGLFVHHTVAGAPLTPEGEKAEMRNLEAIARSRGFSCISYSYVVFPSGRIYEGRGKRIGAHTLNYNSSSYGASAAGNYEVNVPSEALVDSYRWLRREYLDLEDKPLRPHSSVYGTACPGKNLAARLRDM